jgi:PAS domain-containing protein
LPSGTAETPFDEFSTGEASFVVDESFRIVRWSDRATELLGVEKSDAMGKRCYEILNGADANNPVGCGRDCPVLTGTRRNPEVPDYDMLSVSPQGEYRWLNITTLIRGGAAKAQSVDRIPLDR